MSDRSAAPALVELEVGTEAKDAVMTLGERLIEQGRKEGWQQGWKEGWKKGWRQAHQEVLLGGLRRRYGAQVDEAIEQRLMQAPIEQLETWLRRLLTPPTLAEILAD